MFNIKMTETIIDVDNPAILNESKWIGTGKIYPLEEVPEALRNQRFALLTSSQFLRTLSHPPRTTDDGSTLTLTQDDHDIFKALNTRRSDIKKAVTVLTGKKKKGAEDDEMDTDGDEAGEDRQILEILVYVQPQVFTDVWELAAQRTILNTTY